MDHDVIDVIPTAPDENVDKAGLRSLLTRRYAFELAPNENAADFVAADPDTGVCPFALIQNNIHYQFDPLDSTTAAGATCLVTSDNKRYKSDAVGIPFSVLDKDTIAQPGSPSAGDRYIIPTAATGADWAGQDGKIGEYDGARWVFSTIPIGRSVYVRDENAFYYRNNAGTWTAGVGSLVLASGSVPITAVLGAKASFVIKVENQTTMSPPSSPVAPVAYIVPSGASGAWSGQAGKVAMCLVDGAFTLIAPAAGDEVYDKAIGVNVKWNATASAWISAGGAWIGMATPVFTEGSGSQTAPSGGTSYTYSSSSGPTTSVRSRSDDVSISYAAKKTGTKNLRVTWSADVEFARFSANNTGDLVVALYRDAETSPVAWQSLTLPKGVTLVDGVGNPRFHCEHHFWVDAGDTSSHSYKVRVTSSVAGTASNSTDANSFTRRLMTVEERA